MGRKKGGKNKSTRDNLAELAINNARPIATNRTLIPWEVIEEMAHIQCTGQEIAASLKFSYEHLNVRCIEEKGMDILEFIKLNAKGGHSSLRRAQWKTAMDGNVTMQIWLGKQYLGQREKSKEEIELELSARNEAFKQLREEKQELENKTLAELQLVYKEKMGYKDRHFKK